MSKSSWVSVVASCDREEWMRGRTCPPAEIVEEVIRELGLGIAYERLGRAHGKLQVERRVIVINSLLPQLIDPRADVNCVETWTLAHELGHFRLHRAQLCRGIRNAEQERQAHQYAGAFLLPRRELQATPQWQELVRLREARPEDMDRRRWDLARAVAKRFRVSPSAVEVRFSELLGLQTREVAPAPLAESGNVVLLRPRPPAQELQEARWRTARA